MPMSSAVHTMNWISTTVNSDAAQVLERTADAGGDGPRQHQAQVAVLALLGHHVARDERHEHGAEHESLNTR